MKLWKIMLLSCVTMGMATGCVSVGNSVTPEEMLTPEENAELRQGMEEMRQEIQAGLDEASTELYAAMDEVSAELYAAMDEVSAELGAAMDEVRAELREELGEDAEWVGEMIYGEEERPRRLVWKKGQAEDEIEDREAFVESLALEGWKASSESVDGLTEDVTYTVQCRKSVGILDRWKKEYVDIGSITVFRDSNLIAAKIHNIGGTFAKMPELLGESLVKLDADEWLVVVYEAPEDVVKSLRV